MKDFVLHNARVVTAEEEFVGSVRVVGGLISEIARGSTSTGTIDFEGDYLLPGLIDVHTDALERHALPRPGVQWDALSAMVGHDAVLLTSGTTTVFDSIAVGGSGSAMRRDLLPHAVKAIATAADLGMLRAEHLLHLRCDLVHRFVLDLMKPYWTHPLLRFVTTMDDSPCRDERRARNLFEKRRNLPKGTLIGKPEPFADENFETTHEARAFVARKCTEHQILCGNHDDMTAEHVAEAHALGIRISEFPIRLASASAAKQYGHVVICGSANLMNGGSHAGNVSVAELVQRGLVDILCSDYIPASLLSAVFVLTEDSFQLSLPRALAMATSNPAKTFGLNDRGAISSGLRADIIRVRRKNRSTLVRQAWVAGREVLPLGNGLPQL